MADLRHIFPFDECEDAGDRSASLFRFDPQHPPSVSLPAPLSQDSSAYRRRSIREFWQQWFEGEGHSLEDLYPHRLVVAWRLIREMANLRGLIAQDSDWLVDVTNVGNTPWTHPFHFFSSLSGDAVVDGICTERQLPLLPPDIPATNRNGTVSPTYDPNQDEALRDYIRLLEHLAIRRLHLPREKSGRLGLAGLLDPDTARIAMPHPTDLMQFEEILVEKTYECVLESDEGEQEARSWLRTEFGLRAHEIRQVLALVRTHARQVTGIDTPEDWLALQVAKIERLAQRLERREDYRGAVQARERMARLVFRDESKRDEEDHGNIVQATVVDHEAKKRLPKPR